MPSPPPEYAFEAFVVSALFTAPGAAWALGDGTVRFESGEVVQAHDGAVLCAAVHPSDHGIVTGGDDGRLVWTQPGAAPTVLAEFGGRWIDAVATSPATGLIAVAVGRDLHVRDAADPVFARSFRHDRSVADLAFDPKGRRIAAATYGGAMLWYAKIADQRPVALKWAGSHVGAIWSPDGKFVVTAMQENELHGWRLSDAKDMRMAGYPTKVRSLAFLAKGALMASSGAAGAVVWPFTGANGPMGKDAVEVGFTEGAVVTRLAAQLGGMRIVGGVDDGTVWAADLNVAGRSVLREGRGSPVSALAVSADGRRAAYGDEAGGAGVLALP